LRSLLTNISTIANQIINIILIPILLFYFIKDFRRIVNKIKSILETNNQKLLYDIRRIGKILRKYISWQITAAFIVATVCTFFFSFFELPYPTVLGIICGILNPIPYLGFIASMIISALTVLVVGTEDVVMQLLTVVSVISAMHFINTYLLEPNIAGRMIGLHPVLLIASLFVFGGMFGFLGLLIAVPLTATLMMFFNDWAQKIKVQKMETT
jgi:predicted PurR-regulated permease PerM